VDVERVLELVKARIGLTSTVRDDYLLAIIQGVINELEDEKGLSLDGDSPYHLMFVVDYATWRYMNRDSTGAMPRHLQYRLHNLIVHAGRGADDV